MINKLNIDYYFNQINLKCIYHMHSSLLKFDNVYKIILVKSNSSNHNFTIPNYIKQYFKTSLLKM